MKALITGITGQDGSYLAELLLKKGYEVHGIIRRSSSFNTERLEHVFKSLKLYYGDVTEGDGLRNLVWKTQFDEIYNLAAQSHVRVSFDVPEYTTATIALSIVKMLEVIRQFSPNSKFYNAASSEMFGNSKPPQNEDTPFDPRSPYACAKVYAFYMTRMYRKAYGLFAVNGILFNHESPRRGETFVTRKITQSIKKIKSGKQDRISLGNLESKRDWGYAGDYVEAMWLMLQQEKPDDYVIGTGETHSVRKFAEDAFRVAGLDFYKYFRFDPKYIRPLEVDELCADSTKAKSKLGWEPKTSYEKLVPLLVNGELS